MSSSASLAAKPGPVVIDGKRERELARSALGLAAAMGLSGLLTYAFLALAARALGPEAYGKVGVLWGAMYIGAIMLFRPLEQTLSRAIADRRSRGEEGRTVLHAVAWLGLGCVALLALAAGLAWHALSKSLFHGDGVLTALLIVGIALYGGSYLVRGLAGGVMWFDGYGINVVADAVTRLILAAPLVVVASTRVAALAVIGAGLGGAVLPLAMGRRRISRGLRGKVGESFPIGRALEFAAPASTVAAADQVLVNGGPLLILLGGGAGASRAAGVAFAVTMLVRAPVYVFQGVAAALLPSFTHLQAEERAQRLWSATMRIAQPIAAVAAVLVVGAAAVGPTASRLVYGAGFEVTRVVIVWLMIGVAFYLLAATCSQSLFALDAGRDAALAWLVAAALFVCSYSGLPGDRLLRLAEAFVIATAILLVALIAGLRRRSTSSHDRAVSGEAT